MDPIRGVDCVAAIAANSRPLRKAFCDLPTLQSGDVVRRQPRRLTRARACGHGGQRTLLQALTTICIVPLIVTTAGWGVGGD